MKDKPAFPLPRPIDEMAPNTGLTKRELIAAIALQGLLPMYSRYEERARNFASESLCADAISFADELIKQLNNGH